MNLKKQGVLIRFCAVIFILAVSLSAFSACETNSDDGKVFDYEIYFLDDFDGNNLDMTKWTHQLGVGQNPGVIGWGNNEKQYYCAENTEVSNGTLKIHAKLETCGTGAESMPWTSARIYTRNKFYRTYGRFEARIKLPVGQGFWPAFWMMPQNSPYGGWAACGEIDIMEAKGRFPGSTSSALHYGGGYPTNTFVFHEQTFSGSATIDEFHTYAVEWEEYEIRWYVDGVLHFTVNDWWTNGEYPAPFDVDFYMTLNLAVGGKFDGNLMPEVGVKSGVMEIDYVLARSINKIWH